MLKKYWAVLLLCVAISLLWSWLFLIDDARLLGSKFVAAAVMIIVFVVIVAISVFIFWRTIKYLQKNVKHSKNGWVIVKIFFVWAFAEWLVSWLVAVVWMGHNGSWDNILPFSSLTPWLMWTPLRFVTRFVGYYGLSSAVVTGIFVISSKNLRRYGVAYGVVVLLLTTASWGLYARPNGQEIKATIVAEWLGYPTKVVTNDSKLVVVPEYGLDRYTTKNISTRFDTDKKVYFVGSRQTSNPHGFTNTLVFGSNQQGFIREQQKSRLIPGGEYLSLPVEIMLRVYSPNTYTDFQVRRAVIKGSGKGEPFVINDGLILGSAACSSIIAPEDYRQLTNQGATLLTNSSSLEIFRGSRLFNWQHRGLAKFMAVANARPFLQSSHNWPAFALDHNGQQLAEIQPVNSKQVTVTTNNRKTPYTVLGEWPVVIGAVWLGYDLMQRYKKRKT